MIGTLLGRSVRRGGHRRFTEVESGKLADRPEKALHLAEVTGAALHIASLASSLS